MQGYWQMVVSATVFSFELFYAGAAQSAVGARYATYKNNGLVTHHLFTTKSVNEMPKAIPPSQQMGADLAYVNRYYSKVNFQFNCPQHLFMSGVNASYSTFITSGGYNNSSYTFEFTCALLQIDQSSLVQKINCGQAFSPADNMPAPTVSGEKKEETPPDPRAIHDLPKGVRPAAQAASACAPGQFIQGLTYVKYFEGKVMADAFYKSYCCNLVDGQQKPLDATTTCKTYSFPAASSFTMQCGEDMIVQKITSVFDPHVNNRSFEFTCCQVGRAAGVAASAAFLP